MRIITNLNRGPIIPVAQTHAIIEALEPEDLIKIHQIGEEYDETHSEEKAAELAAWRDRIANNVQCMCKKWHHVSRMKKYWTGFVWAFDAVCPNCEKEAKKMARIICKQCRRVQVFVSPHKDSDGFQFVAGRTYHTTSCCVCCDAVNAAIPIEKILFDYERVKPNMALVQYTKLITGQFNQLKLQ